MPGFENSQVRTAEHTDSRQIWIPRFTEDHLHGGLTVFFTPEAESESLNKALFVGHTVAGGGDAAGVSKMAYSYMPEFWGNGIGGSVLHFILTLCAPEVQRIGPRARIQEEDIAVMKAFQCFKGKALSQLAATASPSNPGSWVIIDRGGFKAAGSRGVTLRKTCCSS